MKRDQRVSRTEGSVPLNFAELLEHVDRADALDPRQRRETASAIRSVAKWLHLDPHEVPTAAAALRRHLASLHHERIGVTERRLGNARSLLNKALVLAGVVENNRSVVDVLTPAWQEIFVELTEPYWRVTLTPFARFAVFRGVEPDQVNDKIMDDYLVYLGRIAVLAKPATAHQTVCRIWNKAVAAVPGWPQSLVSVPCYSRQWRLRDDEFPRAFIAEMEAYLAYLSQDDWSDLLDPDAPPRALRPASLKTKRDQILQFSSALVHKGIQVDEITSLSVLVTLQNFRLGLGYILDRPRDDPSNTKTAGLIAHTIRSIARYHLKMDAAILEKIDAITKRLCRSRAGMTDENRRKLAQFDDPKVLADFLSLPRKELARIHAKPKLNKQDAVDASVLLAIELSTHAPMRVKNVVSLNTGSNLRLPEHGGDSAVLLNPDQVKNELSLTYYFPDDVTDLIKKHITRIMPHLEPVRSGYLFPGTEGRSKRPDTLSKQITKLVKDRLGIDFSPHLMRHLAAKMVLETYPGEYEIARRLLGHKSGDTTYKFYSGMETRSAGSLLHQLIRDKRGPGGNPTPISPKKGRS